MRSYVNIKFTAFTAYRRALYIEWRFRGVDIQSVTIYSAISAWNSQHAQLRLTQQTESSPLPDHSQVSNKTAIVVLGMKNNIKKRSAETDMNTNEIVADFLVLVEYIRHCLSTLAGLHRSQNLAEGWHNGFHDTVSHQPLHNFTFIIYTSALDFEDFDLNLDHAINSLTTFKISRPFNYSTCCQIIIIHE